VRNSRPEPSEFSLLQAFAQRLLFERPDVDLLVDGHPWLRLVLA